MGSVDALERDVLSQPAALRSFRPQRPLGPAALRRALFCGSGDSLASCMLAEAHSGLAARAADPLDVALGAVPAAGRDLYAVSVSGRTTAGIRAARRARRAVAVTAAPASALARACGRVMPLRIPNSDAATAGSASFVDSALTCVSLVRPVRVPPAGPLLASAARQARRARLAGRVTFLGGLLEYPLAMYAAAKMHEAVGAPARYERAEQFAHMGLFSARPGDTAVIFGPAGPYSARLAAALRRARMRVVAPDPGPGGPVSRMLFLAFWSQAAALAAARREGRAECHFMSARRLLAASDRMIY